MILIYIIFEILNFLVQFAKSLNILNIECNHWCEMLLSKLEPSPFARCYHSDSARSRKCPSVKSKSDESGFGYKIDNTSGQQTNKWFNYRYLYRLAETFFIYN